MKKCLAPSDNFSYSVAHPRLSSNCCSDYMSTITTII